MKSKSTKAFIKTINSNVDAIDLSEELKAIGIKNEFGDNGVYVNSEDYLTALSAFMTLEEEKR